MRPSFETARDDLACPPLQVHCSCTAYKEVYSCQPSSNLSQPVFVSASAPFCLSVPGEINTVMEFCSPKVSSEVNSVCT